MQDVITKYTQQYDGRSAEDRAETSWEWACWIEDNNKWERLNDAWQRFQKETRITDIDRLVMDEVLSEMKPPEPI